MKDGQGLGNQLWNYVVMRSIAKFKSYDFGVLDYEKFKGKEFLPIKISSTSIPEEELMGQDFFYENLYYDRSLKNISCDYDPTILNIKDNVILEGLFQSEKYLIPNKSIINEFLIINKSNFKLNYDPENTCILNIRGGEYKRHKNLILPKSYWIDAMKNMELLNPKIKFKIVTDDPRYSNLLFPNIEVLKGDIKEDFLSLTSAKYLIISNSSFSYFPMAIDEWPKIIIAPLYWSRFGNQLNRWASPANCYKGMLWQNSKGYIVGEEDIELSLNASRNEYNKYKLRFNSEDHNKPARESKILIICKKFIKIILKIFLPKTF